LTICPKIKIRITTLIKKKINEGIENPFPIKTPATNDPRRKILNNEAQSTKSVKFFCSA